MQLSPAYHTLWIVSLFLSLSICSLSWAQIKSEEEEIDSDKAVSGVLMEIGYWIHAGGWDLWDIVGFQDDFEGFEDFVVAAAVRFANRADDEQGSTAENSDEEAIDEQFDNRDDEVRSPSFQNVKSSFSLNLSARHC